MLYLYSSTGSKITYYPKWIKDKVTMHIQADFSKICLIILLEISLSCFVNGAVCFSSGSGWAIAKNNTANQSTIKFSHIRCIGWNGLEPVDKTEMKTIRKVLRLAVIENCRNRLKIQVIFLEASIRFATVAKLSSMMITSLASLHISVPLIPIDIPIFALLSAGAAFVPSAVIATVLPLFCKASTKFSITSGGALAITLVLLKIS